MKYIQTFRLHPTPEQAAKIRQRFVLAGEAYNWGLAETERVWEEEHRHLSYFDIKDIYQHHFNYHHYRPVSREEHEALCHLDHAYSNFFDKRCKKPCRKEPQDMVSYTILARDILYRSSCHHAYLPLIGRVPCNFYRKVQGNPTTATIKEHNGKFHIVFLTELQEQQPEENNPEVIGIDLGIKHFATLSNGETIDYPEYIWDEKAYRREQCLQRRMARRKKGSRRYEKAKQKLSRFLSHKANQQKDFHYKTAANLTNKFRAIAVEDLAIENIKQIQAPYRRRINRTINHYGFKHFLLRLESRCKRTGTQFLQVGRFEPTSKTCHVCGYISKSLSLKTRDWICPQCHTQHNRDVNAALNIKALGQRIQKTLPRVEREVKTVEQASRSCREAVKVVENQKEKSQPACTLGASKYNISRLARIGEARTVTPTQFLLIVTEFIRLPRVCQILGIKQTQLHRLCMQKNGIPWREQMVQQKCEHLRHSLIQGLKSNLPPLDYAEPQEYVEMFMDGLQDWIRITKIGHEQDDMQPYVVQKNRHAWHQYINKIIDSLENIAITQSYE